MYVENPCSFYDEFLGIHNFNKITFSAKFFSSTNKPPGGDRSGGAAAFFDQPWPARAGPARSGRLAGSGQMGSALHFPLHLFGSGTFPEFAFRAAFLSLDINVPVRNSRGTQSRLRGSPSKLKTSIRRG